MKLVRKFACASALTVAAVAITGGMAGVAGAAGSAPSVSGTVTAVNGDTSPTACGSAGATGSFTLTTNGSTPTVHTIEVGSATSFVEKKISAPTFANVCVGDDAGAIGSETNFVLTASSVSISVPKSTHAFGTVVAVDGVTTPKTCGSAHASGDFTLSTLISGSQVVTTVFVTSDTKFNVSHTGTTTFAGLCVGDYAQAEGLAVGSTVLAASVEVRVPKPPAPLHVTGTVTSVNGATAGCGTADTAGTFVLTWTDKSATVINTTVNVQATTPFTGKSGTTSFAAVCVGAKASAIGTYSSGALEALSVATYPVKV